MKSLPARPDIDHLKRQAKDLLAAFRRGDPDAVARVAQALPAAAGRDPASASRMDLRLHDAQSCIAREYGFDRWATLAAYVDAVRAAADHLEPVAAAFCRLAYAGDLVGGGDQSRPQAAARVLSEHPDLPRTDPWIACAVGDVAAIRRQLAADPAWMDRPGGRLGLTPLVAATHSGLLQLDSHGAGIRDVVAMLLRAGADPNRAVTRQWTATAGANPQEWKASPLHGAAGVNFDPDLTRLLLAAGADPNDNESLYHSLDRPVCTPLLLEARARVSGTNALFRCLDFDDLPTFRLLLAYARAQRSEELTGGRLLLWAIRRRRSAGHVRALIEAGVDVHARTRDDVGAYAQALRYGLTDVAAILQAAGADEGLDEEDRFVAACAAADRDAAERITAERPDLPTSLDETRLRMLPELAAAGASDAVRVMVELGWPVAVRGGDWNASALNLAIFRGDAAMADLLLRHGASWTEEHGMGDNVVGTLSWASRNRPVDNGDWLACAETLVTHGLPVTPVGPETGGQVLVDGRARSFSEEVEAWFANVAGAAVGQARPPGARR